MMNTLRYREHISLPDLYTLIVLSPQFRDYLQAAKRTNESSYSISGISGGSKSVNPYMAQNLELLRTVLLGGSSKYIIQEDRTCSTMIVNDECDNGQYH